MKVIQPKVFNTSTDLLSSNATESNPTYNALTTYVKDDLVDYQTHIYISLVNSNTGHTPDLSPTQWLLVSPNNIHAMFDNSISTTTKKASGGLVVTFFTDRINSLALFNIKGSSVTVSAQVGSSGTPFFTRTVQLDESIITNWYEYFFEPYTQITDLVITDIPTYQGTRVTITLNGTDVEIGHVVYGTLYTLGTTQYGVDIGIKDYSRKDEDEYGNVILTKRNFVKRMNAVVNVDRTSFNFVYKKLSAMRSTPTVWIGNDNEEPLIVFGIYEDFSIAIPFPTYCACSLRIQGLT